MFGMKKKDGLASPPSNNQEIEDVKRRVLGDTMDPLEGLIPQRPMRDTYSMPSQPLMQDEPEETYHEETVPYAPVFVKLEKYGDLLTELSKTESIIQHLKEAIALRDKIDEMHAHVINEIRESTALLESHLDTIDRKFRKPEAPKVDVIKTKPKANHLDKIHDELENLKKELKELK